MDDGSTNFDPIEFIPAQRLTRFRHGGKKKFWLKFMYAFDICKKSDHDTFVFLQDDCLDLKLNDLQHIANTWSESEYVINLINDGRDECWRKHRMGLKPIPTENNTLIEVGFVDCIFMTNRKSIQLVDVPSVPNTWFDRPDKSSGVGANFTRQFRALGVPMLKPEKSFCFHGDHPSTMHPEHRKQVKLISK